MSTATIVDTSVLTVTDCASCGVKFAVPSRMLDERRETGKEFYCPNGHTLVYRKTEAQRLREALEREQARTRQVADQLESATRSNRALRGQVTKERKRVANGVCPCCNRTFANLQRHMTGQHPDFAEVSR